MKYLNRFAVVLIAVALAIPAVVLAKGPSGDHGKSGQPHGKANPNHVNKHCKHQPMVGYNYGGTLAAGSTASNLVINVTHASHAAKSLKSTQVTLTGADAAKARYNPASPFDSSGNPNAGVDLTQFKVQVIGKVGKSKKGCDFQNSASTVRKVVVNGPGGATGPSGPTGPTGPSGNTGEQG